MYRVLNAGHLDYKNKSDNSVQENTTKTVKLGTFVSQPHLYETVKFAWYYTWPFLRTLGTCLSRILARVSHLMLCFTHTFILPVLADLKNPHSSAEIHFPTQFSSFLHKYGKLCSLELTGLRGPTVPAFQIYVYVCTLNRTFSQGKAEVQFSCYQEVSVGWPPV
jgi:hypothetical protein